LNEHRHQIADNNHPEEQVAKAGPTLNVGREVAWIDIGDACYERRTQEGSSRPRNPFFVLPLNTSPAARTVPASPRPVCAVIFNTFGCITISPPHLLYAAATAPPVGGDEVFPERVYPCPNQKCQFVHTVPLWPLWPMKDRYRPLQRKWQKSGTRKKCHFLPLPLNPLYRRLDRPKSGKSGRPATFLPTRKPPVSSGPSKIDFS